MKAEKHPVPKGHPVKKDVVRATHEQESLLARPVVRVKVSKTCEDFCALHSFHAWREQDLTPSFNWLIDFNPNWGIPPAGKLAVIELVTATVLVPKGEWARLRMYTSLGQAASNLDLVLTRQGQVASGQDVLVATHTIRAYSDGLIQFNVNRDNAQTEGHAFICISGYLVEM